MISAALGADLHGSVLRAFLLEEIVFKGENRGIKKKCMIYPIILRIKKEKIHRNNKNKNRFYKEKTGTFSSDSTTKRRKSKS
ncbi:MAG: hypothetical protein ACI32F_01540 [Allobaculum sp.]